MQIESLGNFYFEYTTIGHPTPDPGGDPWLIEIDDVTWLAEEDPNIGINVNRHALEHVMPDKRTLYEHLEQWVYDNETYDPNDYDYGDW